MNAGGKFGDIGSHITRVRVMQADGSIQDLHKQNLQFTYRHSNITAPIILEVEFNLTPADPDELRARVKEIFEYKKNSQPMADRSAGCTFKNPPASAFTKDFKKSFPHLPGSGAGAGQLIDEAGLKGFRIGSAYVSPVHANFISLDPENPNIDDVIAVIKHVQTTVQEKFNITLQREVVIWPEDSGI